MNENNPKGLADIEGLIEDKMHEIADANRGDGTAEVLEREERIRHSLWIDAKIDRLIERVYRLFHRTHKHKPSLY